MRITTKSKTALADTHTPVSIYLKVRDVYPESVLLESSDFHGNENSFSFVGLNPLARFEAKNGIVKTEFILGNAEREITETHISAENPLAEQLNRYVKSFEIAK
ncbi:MAG: anthranilate synthase component I family protein, partial [Dysgonamonadaceae bacterium]|nr:anthranilate synthase component I family protein [Dysgonamonadaceae bacterium]